MPRWKLASRSLACEADLAGAGAAAVAAASAPTVPGTRFARGTRLGNPDSVTPPDVGTCAASAARQPSSAGEVQPPLVLTTLCTCPARLAPCLPRRNQSDSTDSKMGSRCSSPAPALAVGGTMIPSFGWLMGVRKGRSLPLPVGPAETGRSPRAAAPGTGSGPSAGAVGAPSPSTDAPSAGVVPRSNVGAAPVPNVGAAPVPNGAGAPAPNAGAASVLNGGAAPVSRADIEPVS